MNAFGMFGIFVSAFFATGVVGHGNYLTGPLFLVEPPPFVDLTDNGKGLALSCVAQGSPPPVPQWLDQNHRPVVNIPGLREIYKNGTLYLPPFPLSDYRSDVHAAVYICSLSNAVGAIISRECKIRSDNSLPVQVQANSVYAMKGNTALMRCSSSGANVRSTSVSWFKESDQNGKTSLLHTGSKYVITTDGDLYARVIGEADARDKFYCEISNTLTKESVRSPLAQIVLLETRGNFPPKMEYTSTDEIYVRVGQPVDLVCVARGIPPPTYRWYREVGNVLQEIHSVSILLRILDSILHFPRVQSSDNAVYICVASSPLGEDRKKLKLSVVSEVIAFVRPQKQIVDSGSTALFNCTTKGGSGHSSIVWLKNGELLPGSNANVEISRDGETLNVRSVSRSDKGMYQCYARSGDESAQSSAELILGAVAPELKEAFGEQTLQPGQSVSLKCVASGNPHSRILWHLDGGLLYPQGDNIIGSYTNDQDDVVSHLNISSVRVQHGGLYACVARNILGSVQHSALLNVEGAPVSRHGLNLTVVSGVDVYLRCPASGYPIVGTSWQFNGRHLQSEGRHRLFQNGTLRVEAVSSHRDQGEYVCTIRNSREQFANGRLHLTIMEPPQVQPFAFDHDLKEGNRAHVSCTIKSGDLPIDFTWRKDGGPLPHDSSVQQQNLQFVSNLYFSKLSAKHSGHYTCIVSNAVAIANYTAHMQIKVSPVWTSEPMDTSVLFHQTAILNCQSNGFPAPSIVWSKGLGKEMENFLELEETPNVSLLENGSLAVNLAERRDEGHYRCIADNGIGKPLSKTAYLRVNVPAHFRVKSANQSGIAGEKITLTCEAEGDHPLRVTWSSPPPAPIHTRHTPTGLASELRLNYLTRSYAGVYHCTATNSFGYDHMSIHLTVKELPETPRGVEVSEIESRRIRIKWEETSGPLLFYTLQYRKESSEFWHNVTTRSDSLSAQIPSLAPATKYYVRVIATNDLGSSEASKSIIVNTLEEAPTGAPLDVEVGMNDNSLMIQWKPPLEQETNGEILGYEISYGEIDPTDGSNGEFQTKIVKGRHKQSLVLHNLKYYTTYEVTVKAFNRAGLGPGSAPSQQTTAESVPSRAPGNVRCQASSPGSLHLLWDPPSRNHHNGLIQGYKIFYNVAAPEIGFKIANKVKKSVNAETTVNGLEKYTNYSVRVAAFTKAGDGVKTARIYCTTTEDVPDAPAGIKAAVMNANSILISWLPPLKSNGVIIKYYVYIEHPNKKVHKEVIYGEEKGRYIYRNLKEQQHYVFWVVAWTSVGEGPASVKVTQTPITRVPARIASFSGKILAKVGSRVTLDCFTVGLPAPTRQWKKFGHDPANHIPHESWEVLKLAPLAEEDGGNYTCEAENVFGRDAVSFHLIVLSPPLPPVLFSSGTTANSISLAWKIAEDDVNPINGFLISYRGKGEELWSTVEVDSDEKAIVLRPLKCGTKYEIFLQASSSVGYSKASKWIVVQTIGEVPSTVSLEEIATVNSTSVTLHLERWPGGQECPVTSFKVAWKKRSNSWKGGFGGSEGVEVQPGDAFVLSHLEAATKYILRITAWNAAGRSTREYSFATLTENGELASVEWSVENGDFSLYKWNVIIPAVSAVLCVVAIASCVVILLKKRKVYGGYKSGKRSNSESNKADYDGKVEIADTSRRCYHSSPNGNKNEGDAEDESSLAYDICPYATFSVSPQAQMGILPHPLKMKSFAQEYYDSFQPGGAETTAHHIHKRSKSKGEEYNNNLEISCISNQQTLPVGRFGNRSKGRFTSDSDSSAGLQSRPDQRPYPAPKHGTNREYNSSVESMDESPVMQGKLGMHQYR